ncbi:MAG: HEAT repeat domain-containing protein [Pirellulaceae bacterium]|nr:HEAT repeat domain-containing protein [Pirellulaceae bacterium]
MRPLSSSLACVLIFVGAAQCAEDDATTLQRGRQGEAARALSKDEYLHKAYVLGEGVRPPARFTGTWRTWYANGQLQTERSLVNGGSHGRCKQWGAGGRMVASGEYRNGAPFDGSFREWYYLDGSLDKHCYAVVSYRSGRRHGPYSEWTAHGHKLAEGKFSDDERSGRWCWWDLNGALIADGEHKDGRPWSGAFASRLDSRWRLQRYENGDDLQLRALEEASVSELSQIVRDRTKFDSDRWQATRELAKRRIPSSTPILIELLKDEYHAVRGSASWGLCQTGGQDAQDALLEYLRWSLEGSRLGTSLAQRRPKRSFQTSAPSTC